MWARTINYWPERQPALAQNMKPKKNEIHFDFSHKIPQNMSDNSSAIFDLNANRKCDT